MPVIAVIGATGSQGGAVVDALLDKGVNVRGITRDPDSDKASELTSRGVEMVKANLDDKASLVAAFSGADGVFGVTDFYEHFSVDREVQQGKNLVDAAKEVRAHLVLSTLEGVDKGIGNQFKKIHGYALPHFDGKDQITEYAKKSGGFVTFEYTSFYYDNFLTALIPRRQADGRYHMVFNMGDTPMAAVSVKDIGKVAVNAFAAGSALYGECVYAVGDKLTMREYAAAFAREFSDREFVYDEVTTEQYAAQDFPGAEEFANMFQYYRDFPTYFPRDVSVAKEFTPDIQNFRDWLSDNASSFKFDEQETGDAK